MRARALLFACLCVLAGCTGAPAAGTVGTPAGDAPATTTTAGTPPASGSDAPAPPDAGTVTVTVTEVVDGDTVDVEYANGTKDTVRLVGVDTPEVHTEVSPDEFGVPDTAAGRECLRSWGDRASEFAKSRLAGETVTLHFDSNLDRRGYYGRLLAYVTLDGRHFNYDLIRGGYARVYDSDFALKGAFRDAQSRARANGTGVWACGGGGGTATPAGDAPLAVSVHADAAGRESENLNDEYVTLTNRESTAIDMTNWTVTDAADHTYTFGAFELGAGESVVLHTGSGTDTATDLYWGAGSAVWNNGGDTVTVRNATGAVVVEHRYGD